ncbi:hypothetical protein MMC18_003337 [Xylographa bjoerkii]|nr:hypothetical protein [Xylographa bjoerkii]
MSPSESIKWFPVSMIIATLTLFPLYHTISATSHPLPPPLHPSSTRPSTTPNPPAYNDTSPAAAAALAGLATLQEYYNATSGLYATTGWWNSANCLTVLADAALLSPATAALAAPIFANTFARAPHARAKTAARSPADDGAPPCPPAQEPLRPQQPLPHPPSFLNAFYDDEAWWALAFLRAHAATGHAPYLDLAASLFADIARGGPTPCGGGGGGGGGGIWWDKPHRYIAAIANSLFLSLAAQLATRMPAPQQAAYRAAARAQWAWIQASGLLNARRLVNDGLDARRCANNGGPVWTYNQGVLVGALVALAAAEEDEAEEAEDDARRGAEYLAAAVGIADAAMAALADAEGILRERCEPACGADGAQFKGVFVRNLRALWEVVPEERFAVFLERNAERVWRGRGEGARLGLVWGCWDGEGDAGTQSSGVDALVGGWAVEVGRRGGVRG